MAASTLRQPGWLTSPASHAAAASVQHQEIIRRATSTLLAQLMPTPGGFASSHASIALTHALAYRSSPVDRPRLRQADEPLMPVQFPDETAVADARASCTSMRLHGDQRRTSAPKWIEVPVDRIAKPEGAIGEQVEMTLQQVVGRLTEIQPVIRQPCIERRGCGVPIHAGKEALRRDLAQDREAPHPGRRALARASGAARRLLRQIRSAPRVPAIWRLPASRDMRAPRHGMSPIRRCPRSCGSTRRAKRAERRLEGNR